jgi:hypothetical protein
MVPKVGLKPVAPQTVAGETILPHVSVPIAKGTNPATVAEVEPAEEPEDPFFKFQGFQQLTFGLKSGHPMSSAMPPPAIYIH